jgi:hypothetical protein
VGECGEAFTAGLGEQGDRLREELEKQTGRSVG